MSSELRWLILYGLNFSNPLREARSKIGACFGRARRDASVARWLSGLLTVLPLLGLGMVLALVGWPHSTSTVQWLLAASRVIAGAFGVLVWLRWAWVEGPHWQSWRGYLFGPGLALILFTTAVFEDRIGAFFADNVHPVHAWLIALAALQQLLVFLSRFGDWLPLLERSFLSRCSPGVILVFTFTCLILAGCLLLKMPNATTEEISWLDALFTSTSAVCVTGLIVVDTATAFTPMGQGLILLLIQLGAFGIVTLTFLLAVISGQGFSVSSHFLLRDLLSVDNMRNLSGTLTIIIGLTLVFELIGAIALHALWADALHPADAAWWVAVFHAVSAFCNAGFSIFTDGLADGRAVDQRGVQAVILVLVVLGGIGFPVLLEVGRKIRVRLTPGRKHGYAPLFSAHTRLVLLSTVILLVGGSCMLWLGGGAGHFTAFGDQAWEALFNSVTARTAGFNITDMRLLPSASTAVIILLMFIGGSPGGIAGGIKTTTFAIALLNLRRILLNRRDVQIFERRVAEHVTSRAFAVVLLSGLWIFTATALLLYLQPAFALIDTLFETVSAFATVGLSRGITAELSGPSKVVIIATMLVGRIGILNVFFSLMIAQRETSTLRYPQERIIVE